MPSRARSFIHAGINACPVLAAGAALFFALCVNGPDSATSAAPQVPGNASPAPASPPASPYEWFDSIIETRQLLGGAFVEIPDDVAMQQAAIAAMVGSLGDPHTVYVPPKNEREFAKQLRGTYVGIGAEIDIHKNYLRIVSPIDDSPAQEAGVLPGHLVIEIDGVSTLGKSADACMEMLLGESGTPVTLRLRHADGREVDVSITRREIQAQTVKGFRRSQDGWQHMIDPARGVAYVRLTQFTETSAEALRDVVDAAIEHGANALILDLRFNGGGALGAAIQAADLFQRSGSIVSLRGRDGQGRAWSASDQSTDIDLPMVVLVNEASASASEILAGSLQENDRAKVLGTRTFGKGSVQDVRSLPSGRGTIKITTARYYLPSGRNITRSARSSDTGEPWGVDPDPGYHVAMSDDEERAMFIARRNWEIPGALAADPTRWADPDWISAAPGDEGTDGAGDRQLAAAMTALQAKLAGKDWPRVGDDPGATASASDELTRARTYRERLLNEIEATDKRIGELEAVVEHDVRPETDGAREESK